MTTSNVSLTLTCFLASSLAFGKETPCPTLPTFYEPEWCNCAEQLHNLEVTLPQGMAIMSACLYDPFSSPRRWIDLTSERVSLDQYKDGSIPYGTLFFSGERIISGMIIVDPGPSADYWFYPAWDFSQLTTALSSELSSFKFLEEKIAAEFKINSELLDTGCSQARATIRIHGLRVMLGESDEAGAYPFNVEVLSVGEYTPCE